MGTHDLVLYMTKKKILQISSNVLFIWSSVSYMSMASDYMNLSGLLFTKLTWLEVANGRKWSRYILRL